MILMDPPEHRRMRSLVNKVFTPRAVTTLKPVVTETIERFLSGVDPDQFDVVQDFSALFPVEVIATMLGVPPDLRQQVREWVDETLHREPGQIEMSEKGMEAVTKIAMLYYNLIQERRAEPRDDMISALIAAEVERDDGEKTRLDDLEIAGFAVLLGGAGAETVTKAIGNAVVLFARNPDQWQKVLDDRSEIPPRSRRCCAGRRRPSTTSADPWKQYTCTVSRSLRANPSSCWVARRTATLRPSPTPTSLTSTATGKRRRTSDSATEFTAAWARRWPGWKA